MNNRELFLRWMGTAFPVVHYLALRSVQPQLNAHGGALPGLSGLGQDSSLVDSSLTDFGSSIGMPSFSPDYSLSSSIPYEPMFTPNATPTPSNPSTSGDSFGNYLSAVNGITSAAGNIASTIAVSQAQQNLLQINTQRAQMGLAPLSSLGGGIVTPGQLTGTSPTMQSIESNLAGGSGLLLLAALGIGAAVLFSRRRR